MLGYWVCKKVARETPRGGLETNISFQMLAESNVSTFQELGVKKESLPHARTVSTHSAKNTQTMEPTNSRCSITPKFLLLQDEGKLPKIEEREDNITFHDPCYLGRIGGETQAPRSVIGGVDVEPERHGTDSFCCGAGGAQMWMEEDADKRVNVIRAKELAETGATQSP